VRRKAADSNTYRFFVAPGSIAGDEVFVADEVLARQLASVLRLGPGDRVTLLDDSGQRYLVEIQSLERKALRGLVMERYDATGSEARTRVTLYQALTRGERFELVLQKATELGVAAIVPVAYARSAVDPGEAQRKRDRWERILREAAEQSCRGRLPTLAGPLAFADACGAAAAFDLSVVLWEGAAPPLRAVLRECGTPQAITSVALWSGPEGGLSAEEVALAQNRGSRVASLGPRILRAETAPLVALSVVLYECGDLD
jgi:16S rRNA (uracil1498-N3)-methyltransferase